MRSVKRWTYRRKNRQSLTMVILMIGMLAGMVTCWRLEKQSRVMKREIAEKEQQLSEYRMEVYSAGRNLYRGEILTKEDVVLVQGFTDGVKDYFIGEDDFGKELLVDVPIGTYLCQYMLLGVTEGGQREVFLSDIELNGFISEGDRIDLRISYEDGEDYIILAEKRVLYTDSRNALVLCLEEPELLWVSSAMADRKVYEHVRIYAVKYSEQIASRKSEVNYIPNQEILLLVEKKELCGARKELEMRLQSEKEVFTERGK